MDYNDDNIREWNVGDIEQQAAHQWNDLHIDMVTRSVYNNKAVVLRTIYMLNYSRCNVKWTEKDLLTKYFLVII